MGKVSGRRIFFFHNIKDNMRIYITFFNAKAESFGLWIPNENLSLAVYIFYDAIKNVIASELQYLMHLILVKLIIHGSRDRR